MRSKELRPHTPATYHIHVQGILDESWSDRLGGVVISRAGGTGQSPATILSGRVPDQAALLGILNTLYDLLLPLLSIECEDWEEDYFE